MGKKKGGGKAKSSGISFRRRPKRTPSLRASTTEHIPPQTPIIKKNRGNTGESDTLVLGARSSARLRNKSPIKLSPFPLRGATRDGKRTHYTNVLLRKVIKKNTKNQICKESDERKIIRHHHHFVLAPSYRCPESESVFARSPCDR